MQLWETLLRAGQEGDTHFWRQEVGKVAKRGARREGEIWEEV